MDITKQAMRISSNYQQAHGGSSHLASEEPNDDNELESIQHKQDRVRVLTGKIFLTFIIFNSILFCLLGALLVGNGISMANSRWREEQYELADTIENYGDKTTSSAGLYLLESQQSKVPIQGLNRFPVNYKYQQLPFCLFQVVEPGSQYKLQQIQQSIASLEYRNHWSIVVSSSNDQSGAHPYAYSRTYELLQKSKCPKNSLLMFVNQPILPSALTYLNELFQTYNIWAAFVNNESDRTYELVAFYWRIYELLRVNDFDRSNLKYFSLGSNEAASNSREHVSELAKGIQMRGIMELSAIHFKYVARHRIFQEGQRRSFFNLNRSSPIQIPGRTAYKKLTKLSQDYSANVSESLQYRYNYRNREVQRQSRAASNLSEDQMDTAIERMQIPYLPLGHNIMALEKLEYEQNYGIQNYSQQEELPFCLTVMSRNNVEQGRYRKVLDTILQQKYSNYHIVFIDDFSNDDTLNHTMRYLREHNFPEGRVTFVRNKKQMFATYNIINAAYNFCHPNDIQMLVDGDDELIGRYVINVFNAVYQNSEKVHGKSLWYVYCNYKDNWYLYGRSQKVKSEEEHYKNGHRVQDLFIGAIRTWKLNLLYNVPLPYHQKQDGSWLDTVYDDALAHPLLELSTRSRVEYIPQIMYEYNRGYGNNDDSSRAKIEYRKKVYSWVMSMPKLGVLSENQFESSRKNAQIDSVLRKDEGLCYQKVLAT